MKKLILSILLYSLFSIFYIKSEAQLLKRIKSEVQSKIENRAVSKSGDVADDAMDKTENSVKKTISGKKEAGENKIADKTEHSSSANGGSIARATPQDYKDYDFVPGDKIIFQPDMSNEADAELPARFTIKKKDSRNSKFRRRKDTPPAAECKYRSRTTDEFGTLSY